MDCKYRSKQFSSFSLLAIHNSFFPVNTTDNYCPASIKDESFPGTSSWQLHSSQLYVYNTPLGQGCGGQIQKVEFCYKKGTFPSVAFTLVILKRYSWSLQIVKKVELKANPYQDKCGGDVEHWKCCAERAIDPIIVKPDYLYGVAVATHSDNVPVGFYGRTVLGYTRGMAAGGSIEQAVASIRGQQPTFTTLLAVVRFRVSLIPVILVCLSFCLCQCT